MTQVHERERQLHHDVSETLESVLPGVEVLAVELGGPDRLCVFIDEPSGVDHALCERVTHALRGYLDRYSLEVSSPGLERPLRTHAHFARSAGRRVSVRTAEPISGRRRFRGEVVAAGEAVVTVLCGRERVEIPYGAIARANLIDVER